jgi:NAD(P)H dehydrogenase (quinone)
MILVTGAAGKTGKAIIKALAAKGAKTRALIRRPDQTATLITAGATEVVIGSFDDPVSLSRSAAGVQAIYHICPNVSRDEIVYARAVAAAAHERKVSRFVFHSVLHPQIEAMTHHWQKMRVEEFLFTAGFDLTILQPTAYMQNILGAWRGIVDQGILRVPYPADTKLCLVDLDDVAEAAALVLTTDGHSGATYELVGTPPLSQIDVATALGKALGREVRAEEELVEAWTAHARAAGMDDHECETLAAMFRYYAAHGLIGNSNTLHWLFGRPPNDLGAFLSRAMATIA